MEKRQFVYHSMYKFGIVIEKTDDFYKILFLKNGEKILNRSLVDNDKNSFIVLSDRASNCIEDETALDRFTSFTNTKGLNYFELGKVKDYRISKKMLEAKVEGSENYFVDIEPTNLNIKCSCPVGFNCKHQSAVIYDLIDKYQKIMKILTNDTIETKAVSKDSIDNDVINMINGFNKDVSVEYYESYINLTKSIIKEPKLSKIIDIINYLNILKNKNITKDVLTILTKNKKIKKITNTFLSDVRVQKFYSNNKRIIDNINIESLGYYEDKLVEKFINLDFNDYIVLFSRMSRYKDDENDYRFLAILKNEELDKGILDECREIVSNLTFTDELLAIYKNSSVSKQQQLLPILSNAKLDIADYEIFSLEEIINMAFKKANNKNLVDYIINSLDEIINNDDLFKKVLYIVNKYDHVTQRNKLFTKLKKYGYNSIYYDYLCANYNSSYSAQIPLDSILQSNDSLLDEKLIYDLYDFTFSVNEEKNRIKIDAALEFFNEKVFNISYYLNDNVIYFNYRNEDYYKYAKYLYNKVLYLPVVIENINSIKEKIRLKEEKRLNDEFDRSVDLFLQQVKPLEVVYNDDYKVKLELYFTKSSKPQLELKIGRDKMYIVRNIVMLQELFRYNEFYSYGKNLEFTHSFNNLIPPYDKVLQYIFNNLLRRNDTREVTVKNDHLLPLLNLLKNEVVYFDSIPYKVVLDEIDLKCRISKDYVLSLDIPKKNIFKLDDNILILDSKSHEINMLKNDKKIYLLYEFIEKMSNVSLIKQKDKIKDLIYSRFKDNFIIAEGIKEDFKLDEITINAYFDLEDSNIVVRNEFEKNDIKIDINDIDSHIDSMKLNSYFSYLSSLGFVDNTILDEGDNLEFFKLDFTYLKTLANVYLSDAITNKSLSNLTPPIIKINYNNNMMDVFLEESLYDEEDLINILKAIKKKRKFILLKNNNIVDLSSNEVTEFYNTVTDLKIDEKDPLKRNVLPIYQSIKAYAHLDNCQMDEYLLNMIEEISNFKNADYELPKLDANLRSYQREGFNWLMILKKYHMGGILADDMGLGKTLQIIALIAKSEEEKPSLIVCPKSLIFNWKNEFQRFCNYIDVYEIYGNANDRQNMIKNIDYNKKCVYVTSYDSVGRDLDFYNNEFNFLVIDEAQAIKNVYTKKALNVKQIKACYKYALTGTPIENNVLDLWSIFDFLMPDYFEEITKFKSKYEHNQEFASSISRKVAPFILRRNKRDVLKDLPNKYERILTCQMDSDQKMLYDAESLRARNILETGGGSFDVLYILTRLRQICVDPKLYVENYQAESAKMNMLSELVDDYITDHKILIFSQFVKALNIVEDMLDKKKIKYYMLTGETEAKERLNLANKFNSSDDIKVFLISLKAGGTGLNLIGADTVIHLDPWWNSSVMDQATDRAYRIGQKKNVEVIKLICEDSIEQRVIELQNLKKDIIDKLIANNDERISSLSKEDLKFILN